MNLIKKIDEWVERQDRISRVRQDIEMHLDLMDELRANPDMNFLRTHDDYYFPEIKRASVSLNHPEGLYYYHRELAEQLSYLEKNSHMKDTWLVEIKAPWYVLESVRTKKTRLPKRALPRREW